MMNQMPLATNGDERFARKSSLTRIAYSRFARPWFEHAAFGLLLFLVATTTVLAQTALLTESVKLLGQTGEGDLFDGFGTSVAIQDDLALVGEPEGDTGAINLGKVYVFTRDSYGMWLHHSTLAASDASANGNFGARVTLDGNIALISALDGPDFGTAAGSVYVFERDAFGVWTERTKLIPTDGSPGGVFGSSISLSGNTAIVGAPMDDDGGQNSGSVYVFEMDTAGNWMQVAKLYASDAAAEDRFGVSVDVDDGAAVVGAVLNDQKANNAGAAYAFVQDITGAWIQEAKMIAADGAADDLFGRHIALDEDTAIIGAIEAAGNVISGGAVYAFVRSQAGTWSQQAKFYPLDGGDDEFGASVDLHNDTAVIGSWSHDHGASNTGAAYVFQRDSDGNWEERLELLASDRSAQAHLSGFEGGVSISGLTVVAGAPFPGNAVPAAAYIFDLTPIAPPDNQPPSVSGVFTMPNLLAVNTSADLNATVDDSASGNSNIASAAYSVDAGPFVAMTAKDAVFDSPVEVVSAIVHGSGDADVHNVCVRGTDELGNVSDPATDPSNACAFFVVYDPSAGFVTGGGWIYSASGACQYDAVCSNAAGKGNFGFVSRYKKGATVPTGSTEFRFTAGGLNFHSETYDWLVVNMNGSNSQFKGSGSINGDLSPSGQEYKFMIWARDFRNSGIDTFRIKVWYVDAGAEVVVYDNGFNQEIGGGNIVVHTK